MAAEFISTYTEEEKNFFMREALAEAKKAFEEEEVPIGAIVVLNGEIIGRGYNIREYSQDATTHAEMTAIRAANAKVGSWRLEHAALFVTVEPCMMCSGAAILARIPEIYFGAVNAKGGMAESVLNLFNLPELNHAPYVEGDILSAECGRIMTSFFKDKRERAKVLKKSAGQSDEGAI
jgi:tRNA(adenine34) deaminase